jgi:hypothetical protein
VRLQTDTCRDPWRWRCRNQGLQIVGSGSWIFHIGDCRPRMQRRCLLGLSVVILVDSRRLKRSSLLPKSINFKVIRMFTYWIQGTRLISNQNSIGKQHATSLKGTGTSPPQTNIVSPILKLVFPTFPLRIHPFMYLWKASVFCYNSVSQVSADSGRH